MIKSIESKGVNISSLEAPTSYIQCWNCIQLMPCVVLLVGVINIAKNHLIYSGPLGHENDVNVKDKGVKRYADYADGIM